MRKLMAKGFVTEFVSIIALIFTVALAWIGDLLELSTGVVVSASVGISVAAYIWALKWEINREIQGKLALYSLLETIEDEDLYERGKTAIEECRVELENLSRGILRVDPGHLRRYLTKLADSARHHMRVTHIGLEKSHMEMWEPDAAQEWYQHNVDLVKRGVVFERFFIFSRATAIDTTTGKLKHDISALLQKQERDGIGVQVVWIDKIDDAELVQDFVIVDSSVVYTAAQAWSGGYADARIYRRKFDVERYIDIFEALRSRGYSLSDLSDLLPTSQPDRGG
jgi:hypothetical protein